MAAAGSITTAIADLGGGFTKYTMAWVSDASGAVQENAVSIRRGHIHQAQFTPDSGGTQPADLHDVTLLDRVSGGFDVLVGFGANLSNASRKVGVANDGQLRPLPPAFWEGGSLYPTVANAGSAKGGTIALIVGP